MDPPIRASHVGISTANWLVGKIAPEVGGEFVVEVSRAVAASRTCKSPGHDLSRRPDHEVMALRDGNMFLCMYERRRTG